MKLRDLTQDQIDSNQSRCDKEFETFWDVVIKTNKQMSTKDIWRQAWSNGLKTGLEYAK
jgi:hypothetical protein